MVGKGYAVECGRSDLALFRGVRGGMVLAFASTLCALHPCAHVRARGADGDGARINLPAMFTFPSLRARSRDVSPTFGLAQPESFGGTNEKARCERGSGMLNSPKFVQTRNPNLSSWSCLQRRLRSLTANDLLGVLGKPWRYWGPYNPSPDGKVTMEWHFLDTYGRIVTLYDYKQNAVDDLDRLVVWSIGGFDPEPAHEFEVWLLAQIAMAEEPRDLVSQLATDPGPLYAMVEEPRSDDDQFETDDAMAGWDTCRTECTHCNGFGSSLKEAAARCTKCGGTGLVE